MDLSYTDPAQHIITAGYNLDYLDLDRHLSVRHEHYLLAADTIALTHLRVGRYARASKRVVSSVRLACFR